MLFRSGFFGSVSAQLFSDFCFICSLCVLFTCQFGAVASTPTKPGTIDRHMMIFFDEVKQAFCRQGTSNYECLNCCSLFEIVDIFFLWR